MMMQGSLQHLPAITDDPMSYGCSNWDRLIACRDIGVQSKEHLNRSRVEMNGGMPSASHFNNPVNLNDPLFFHPQHPRSAENFDLGEYPVMTEKSSAIPQRLYPAYQLPGLNYGMRHDGSVLISARYNYSVPNKRNIDAAQQEVATAGVPNKKRRLTDPAN
ncbi:hypothetical protein RSOLAG22IIIB_04816 [Rhizoctonia solani]|uniref:Uncharacterized protein n=1 Tax=Rhizoctonia solani TaxID=456999 RepID=A0A0K6G031_9AGAM|nr:unnamed protein product [Rhizoctonia solani]CUA71870.1 hypothetical protein RSOLAG22IIIB_04816 [Rhizoctonia solani]